MRQSTRAELRGDHAGVCIRVTPPPAPTALLRDALANVTTEAVVPPLPADTPPLLDFVHVDLDLALFLEHGALRGELTVNNPFACATNVTHAHVDVYHTSPVSGAVTHVGHANTTLWPPVHVPPLSRTTTPPLLVHVDAYTDWTLLKALIGDTFLDVNGTLSVVIDDGYEEHDLPYAQRRVPASFRHTEGDGGAPASRR
mmetsp:Transcript_26636/g.64701  ORF Transcript_26636/g.64701 Transcript_26636/m.64701 type:complete len:199 (+) Transcript_26636:450-1046(+)